jgi:hypothetical protein
MKKIMSGLVSATLAASFSMATALPLGAAPAYAPSNSAESSVQTVQYDPWRMGRHGERRHYRDYRRDRSYDDGGGDVMYYNGHRGYREYHRGYREQNGFWFPAAAFLAGALITGAINEAPRSDNSRVEWCYDHYRSYRAYDNTYQPRRGPRRQC